MIKKSKTIGELAKALCAAQGQMPAAKKDATNPFFNSKYADLSSVMATAIPVLSKHGLSISQLISNLDGGSALETILMHESGEYVSATMPLLLKGVKAKNSDVLLPPDSQSQGSAITYARRYAFMAAIGMVADDDDDGNAATSRKTEQQPKTYSGNKIGIGPITDAQIRKIAVMMPQTGKYKDIKDYEAQTGVNVSKLSKQQGSELIAKLTDASMVKVVDDAKLNDEEFAGLDFGEDSE